MKAPIGTINQSPATKNQATKRIDRARRLESSEYRRERRRNGCRRNCSNYKVTPNEGKKEERKEKEKGNILDASILAKIPYESCERPQHLLKSTSLYWLQISEPRLRRSCFRARWGLTGCRDQMRVIIYCICSYTPMNPMGSLVTGTGRQCVLVLDK